MGLLQRVRDAMTHRPDEQRGSTQDYVDLFAAAQEHGFLRTTMASLDEEKVVGSLTGIAKNNGPTFALMMARLQVFSQARFQWTRFERGEPTDLFGSPDLRLLERPWSGGVTADLLARMEVDVTTAGNCYIRRLRRGRQSRLVRLRPDWVTVILGSQEDADTPAEAADVEVIGYAYAPYGSPDRMQIFLAEDNEIAHYAPYPDPDALFVGMSWLTPVLSDVLGDNLQNEHKRAFLRNAATPNLAIKFDPTITIDAVRKFKELLESEHKGAFNAYKTLYLGGGADPVPIGKDFKEIDFAITQGKAESRLASVAGVPPSWVGFSEGLQGSALNAGNFTAARRRFGDGTLQHMWQNVSASLEPILDRPDGGAYLWFATRGIPFLHMDAKDEAEVQSAQASTITTLVRDGFTPASAVDAIVNNDLNRLVHTGLLSVQLQPPGTVMGQQSSASGPEPSSNGNRARIALPAGGLHDDDG